MRALKVVATFLGLFVFFYLLVTTPTWFKKLSFKLNPPKDISYNELTVPVSQNPSTSLNPPATPTTAQKQKIKFPKNLNNNSLTIPTLGVTAPISFNVAVDTNSLLTALKTGLTHFSGSALPDQNGNTFISGHSSYYWWDKGKFKTVFANLPEINNGEKIYINYNNKPYIYEVIGTTVVSPSQTEVMDATAEPILSLMTCVPVGTANKRLIVKAKRTYPLESATINNRSIKLQKLPAII